MIAIILDPPSGATGLHHASPASPTPSVALDRCLDSLCPNRLDCDDIHEAAGVTGHSPVVLQTGQVCAIVLLPGTWPLARREELCGVALGAANCHRHAKRWLEMAASRFELAFALALPWRTLVL